MHEAANNNPQEMDCSSVQHKPKQPIRLVDCKDKSSMFFSKLSSSRTMDIIFQDIHYTVPLGFRRGDC